jgi:large subunit ribosomal protein L17
MRHQRAVKHLNRTSSHRKAMSRNMVASLFEHGRIETTKEKAKFVRGFAERLITLAKKGDLHARRRAISLLQDRKICVEGKQVDTVIGKLFKEIGPRFTDRQGGYTRIIKLPYRRIGDNGQIAVLELVGDETTTATVAAPVVAEATVDAPAEAAAT